MRKKLVLQNHEGPFGLKQTISTWLEASCYKTLKRSSTKGLHLGLKLKLNVVQRLILAT